MMKSVADVGALSSDLRRARAQLRAVSLLGRDLAAHRHPDQLLRHVCVAVRAIFGATYVTLGLIDTDDHLVQSFTDCGGDDDDPRLERGQLVPALLRPVVAEGRMVRGETGGGQADAFGVFSRHPHARPFLAAPIASRVAVYGWLYVVRSGGPAFTEDDEHVVAAVTGQFSRVYELEQEVHERQAAEAHIRGERDRAQGYLDTAQVILLALDVRGRITMVNRYACVLLGWPEAELLGRDFIETCIPAEIRVETRRLFGAVLTGPDSSTVENPVVTRSGTTRMIEWRNRLLRDQDGHVVSTLSSGTDLTERQVALEQQLTADARIQFVLESASVGIWDMNYATGALTWSAILEAQYGLAPGTFGGTMDAFLTLVHPEDRPALLATITHATKFGTDFTIQHRAIRPDGAVRWLTGAGRVHRQADGTPARAVGVSLDVTDRHAAEEQSQQAQKLEAIGRLAGSVAHDFNNVLTAILGYCSLLLADLGPDDPRAADILAIREAGRSAAALTRQLLAFSRRELLAPTVLDLNAVLTDLQPMLRRLIREDVTIALRLAPALAFITVDRGQLEQVIVNLAVNARDAMPSGGRLTFETAPIVLDEHYAELHPTATQGRYVALIVTDTGIGMPPQVRAHIFEPFFTTKAVGAGTGLGLATVHGIVTQHGGSIDVYSEVGRGTSFKAFFPSTDAATVSDPSVPETPPLRGSETVLVVEDEPALRVLIERLLTRQGYTVLIAATGDQAIAHLAQHAVIDVLLTDVMMPGVRGPELATQLLALRPALKVIYMSGYMEEALVSPAGRQGRAAFLRKPFTADTLGSKIREVIQSEGH